MYKNRVVGIHSFLHGFYYPRTGSPQGREVVVPDGDVIFGHDSQRKNSDSPSLSQMIIEFSTESTRRINKNDNCNRLYGGPQKNLSIP